MIHAKATLTDVVTTVAVVAEVSRHGATALSDRQRGDRYARGLETILDVLGWAHRNGIEEASST